MSNETICGLYTRVSSRNQLEPEFGSLDAQKERLEAYCKAQGYKVYRVYEDAAYSGDTIDRPALRQMMTDMQLGLINCVVAYKIDRLTRSVKDFHQLMEIFDRFGATFVSVTQNIDTQTPTGRLMRNVLLDFAQFEREMIADRTRDKMEQRAERGLWNGGIAPYGYEKKDKKLVPNREEAARIKFMFEFFSQTPSLAALRDELLKKAWKNRSGHPWSKTALAHVLANQVYVGKTQFKDKLFQGEHEAIISQAVFDCCQTQPRLCTHPTARTERTFLLRGLVRCKVCGSMMTPHYTRKTRKDGQQYEIPYYRCTKSMSFGNKSCTIKSKNATQLEKQVLDGITQLSLNPEYIEKTVAEINGDLEGSVKPLKSELAQVNKQVADFENEIRRYVKALGKGRLSAEKLEEEIAAVSKDLERVKLRKTELERQLNASAIRAYDAVLFKRSLSELRGSIERLEPKELAGTLQVVLKGVLVHSDKTELEVAELPDYVPIGSKKSETWLPGLDSNQQPSD